jgi:VCBS repeat-containing protein
MLLDEQKQVNKIKVTSLYYNGDSSFTITKEDGTEIQILIELYSCDDAGIVEFYDNNVLIARAKGFDSLL